MKFFGIALQCLLLSPTTGIPGAAAVPAAINARVGTERVERSFVGDESALSYEDQLIRFIVHLYDKHDNYLEEFHRNQMRTILMFRTSNRGPQEAVINGLSYVGTLSAASKLFSQLAKDHPTTALSRSMVMGHSPTQ